VSAGRIAIACGRCGTPGTVPLSAEETSTTCGRCGVNTRVLAFPALLREDTPEQTGSRIVADESACFYHANKPARVVCDGCGRFLCALCDIDYRGRHVCASCLESGRAETDGDTFRSRYIHYDTAALAVALFPVVLPFFWFFSVISAPVAIFLAIYFWREPMSALPRVRVRWRALLAIALGALQLSLWVGLIGTVLAGFFDV